MPGLRPACALALAAVLLTGCDGTDPSALDEASPYEDLVAEIRAATASFEEIDTALAAGYQEASPCVETGDGAMGFHYANNGLIDDAVDVDRAEVLLYVPGTGETLTLVGVEFMVAADAWDASHSGPPMLVDQAFADHRAEDQRHGIPFAHYDLHVWAWESNSLGLFAPFNPRLSC